MTQRHRIRGDFIQIKFSFNISGYALNLFAFQH